MDTVRRHCKRCNKETPHDHTRELEGATRLILGAFTFGGSELGNDHIFECQVCGKKTTRD